jgi:hypothetical protein
MLMSVERSLRLRRTTIPRRRGITRYYGITLLFRWSGSPLTYVMVHLIQYARREGAEDKGKVSLTYYHVVVAVVQDMALQVGIDCKAAAVHTGRADVGHSQTGR